MKIFKELNGDRRRRSLMCLDTGSNIFVRLAEDLKREWMSLKLRREC